jgi:hypothetical protein
MDGRVMAIHFMDFEVETSEKTFDTLENYLDEWFNTY